MTLHRWLKPMVLLLAWLLTPAVGWAVCSPHVGKVVFNELHQPTNGTSFLELKVLNPSVVSATNSFSNWKIDMYAGSFSAKTDADVKSGYTNISVNSCGQTSLWIRFPDSTLEYLRTKVPPFNFVLYDSSNDGQIVDIFRVSDENNQLTSYYGAGTRYQSCPTIENQLPALGTAYSQYDTLKNTAGNSVKDWFRVPDGTGPWSGQETANNKNTACADNSGTSSTFGLAKVANTNATTANTDFSYTLYAVNGNTAVSSPASVVISDDLTAAGLTFVSCSALPGTTSGTSSGPTGTCTHSNGVVTWTVGTMAANKQYKVTLTVQSSTNGNKVNTITSNVGSASATAAPVSITGATNVDHYELSLNTSSVACLASTVTVTACADASSPCTNKSTAVSGQTATLSTSGGTLAATTVTFNASGVASTTLSYPTAANNTSVTVTLSGEQSAGVNPRKCCPDGINCAAANSCSTTFNTAGFIFATAAGGASTTVATQTAGTASATHYLRAVKTNTSTQACESALSGAQSVNFAYECHNPATCSASNLMSVSGTTIQRNDNGASLSYLPVSLTFDANGNAPFTFIFNDVGQTSLHASKSAGGSLLTALSGSSNAFVTKPAGFTLSGIKCSTHGSGTCAPTLASPGNNPGATAASGPAFIQAGRDFSVTATAVTSTGSATPNYGKETAPEGVKLSATRILPASGGASPVLTNATAFGSFSSGAATGSTFKWSEVGIITLTPSVGDGDYLGVGDVTGTTSGNVGRFIANHLTTTVTPGCNAGAYTYSGQPLSTSVKAYANGGTSPLQNYDSTLGFAQTVTLSDASGATVGSLSNTSLPASSFSAGTATQTTAAYTFTNRSTAPTTITLRATDADQISSSGQAEGTAAIRSGRVRLFNAYGSEQLDLPMTLRAEYWNGSGWVQNTSDNCTGDTSLGAANGVTLSRSSTLSCVLDNGSPGLSGIGCTAAGSTSPTDKRYREGTTMVTGPGSLQKGDFNLWLQKPTGAGSLTITADVPTWLEYPWTSSSASDPSARATFGVYKSPYIYRRENY